jgi:hypothetical protein
MQTVSSRCLATILATQQEPRKLASRTPEEFESWEDLATARQRERVSSDLEEVASTIERLISSRDNVSGPVLSHAGTWIPAPMVNRAARVCAARAWDPQYMSASWAPCSAGRLAWISRRRCEGSCRYEARLTSWHMNGSL